MSYDPTNTRPDARAAALEAFVGGRMCMPFDWGTNDCCMFAADWVHGLTGRDPAADVRWTYGDAAGALSTLAALGGLDTVGARAGGDECPPLSARAGDVGLVVHEGRELLGVCVGELWVAPTGSGLAALPLQTARRAWRVVDV